MSSSVSTAMNIAADPSVSNANYPPANDYFFKPENGAKIIIAMTGADNDYFGFNQSALNSEIVVLLSGSLTSILKKLEQGLALYEDDVANYDPVVVVKGSNHGWVKRTVNINSTSTQDLIDYVGQILTKPENQNAFSVTPPAP